MLAARPDCAWMSDQAGPIPRAPEGLRPRRYNPHQGNMAATMVPVRDLFESHLTVTDLERSMTFFGQTLGLELAQVFGERRAAFYWIGGRGNSMLGLWEVG